MSTRSLFEKATWLDPEECAYPSGGQTRKGQARCDLDGKLYTVYGGIPDTFFSIPAHMKKGDTYVAGYLHMDVEALSFHPYVKYHRLFHGEN